MSREKVLLFYKARKNRIQVFADDGTSLSLPWELFRNFVTEAGLDGRFLIEFDASGKAIRLELLE